METIVVQLVDLIKHTVLCIISFTVEADDVKKILSTVNAVSNEKVKQTKVGLRMCILLVVVTFRRCCWNLNVLLCTCI